MMQIGTVLIVKLTSSPFISIASLHSLVTPQPSLPNQTSH